MPRRLVVLIALLGFALAAPSSQARAKACPRLCRQDMKQCKATCQGTKAARRQCKRGCKVGLLAIRKSFTEAARTPPIGACGPAPLTCPLLALVFEGFVVHDASGLPADFPPPPGSATLCGSVTRSGSNGSAVVVFYTTVAPPDDIVTYSGQAFPAHGFEFAEGPVDADRLG